MPAPPRIPIREDLFTLPLEREETVCLAASRCANCDEVFLGKRTFCENCSAQTMEPIALGCEGVLWSYTVVRHPPPAGYKAPGPFQPYGLGLVELPEGIRVLSPLDVDIDQLHIGMKLRLAVYSLYTNEQNQQVMAFKFMPV